MKTLYLPLKKEWYEMIERGEKREEYRECSPYWIQRLMHYDYDGSPTGDHGVKPISSADAHVIDPFIIRENPYIDFKDFDAVCFSYGYTERRMLWECKGITVGRGRPEWGAPDYEVFIIKLANRL